MDVGIMMHGKTQEELDKENAERKEKGLDKIDMDYYKIL